MTCLRVRGLRRVAALLAITLMIVTILAPTGIPFVRLPGPGMGGVPMGVLLASVPVLTVTIVWRDVAAPVTATTPRPGASERAILLGSMLPPALLLVGVLAWRLAGQTPAATIAGHVAGFAGLAAIGTATLGARRCWWPVIMVVAALGLTATAWTPATWPWMPDHRGYVLLIGLMLTCLGFGLAYIRGLDMGRLRNDEMVGQNDT